MLETCTWVTVLVILSLKHVGFTAVLQLICLRNIQNNQPNSGLQVGLLIQKHRNTWLVGLTEAVRKCWLAGPRHLCLLCKTR